MRKKLIYFVVFALALPVSLIAQNDSAIEADSGRPRINVALTPEICLGARLVASGDYLWKLGSLFEVGGGLAADYGFTSGDLWLCPYGRIDLCRFAYFKAGLTVLAWPWVAKDSYYIYGSEDYFVTTPVSLYFSSGLQFGGLAVGPGKLDFDIHLTMSPRPLEEEASGLDALNTLLQGGAGIVYRL